MESFGKLAIETWRVFQWGMSDLPSVVKPDKISTCVINDSLEPDCISRTIGSSK